MSSSSTNFFIFSPEDIASVSEWQEPQEPMVNVSSRSLLSIEQKQIQRENRKARLSLFRSPDLVQLGAKFEREENKAKLVVNTMNSSSSTTKEEKKEAQGLKAFRTNFVAEYQPVVNRPKPPIVPRPK